MRHVAWGAALAAVAAAVLVVPMPAGAVACTIEQVTSEVTGLSVPFNTSLDDAGEQLAFYSQGDHTGDNPEHNPESFLYDIASGVTTQITDTPSGFGGSHPTLDGIGDHVVYYSNQNPLGPNTDNTFEAFVYDIETQGTTQITNGSGGTFNPSPDADGSRVAFVSSSDLASSNPQNGDGNFELFLWESPSTITQLTNTATVVNGPAANLDASINADGTRIAFVSDRDLVPPNNDDLNHEVFLYDTNGPTTVQQLTDTTGGTAQFSTPTSQTSISADGTKVAFASNRDITGNNADLNREVFVVDTNGPTVTQLTDTTGGSLSSGNIRPHISADGTRVVAAHLDDLGGENPDGNLEIISSDLPTGRMDLITDTLGGFSAEASSSADGTRVAFRAEHDLTGDNADGNTELFLASCGAAGPTFDDVPTTNPFYDQVEWMTAVDVASGFPDGTFRGQDAVKRQQMANFLYNLAGQPAFVPPDNANRTFTDYPSSSTFYLQVEWMAAEAIASGFPDGTFRGQDPVKRQQMANFLFNFATCCEVDLA